MGVLSALRGDRVPAEQPGDSPLEQAILEIAALSANEEIFRERITELELALHDGDTEMWSAVFGDSDDFQFSRSFLDELIHASRLYYIKNPVIKRPVDLQAIYVWAQGVSIRSNAEIDSVVKGFLADPANKSSFSGHDALMDMERKVRCEGNLFLRFFTGPKSGRLKVRRIPVNEVRAVVFNPDDHDEPWFYVRKIRRGRGEPDKVVAYPDWRYARERRIEKAAGEGLAGRLSMTALADYPEAVSEWETPVMHRKTGGFSDMDFGIPETYAAIDWAKAYKSALEDYKKTIKSLATWAWKMKMGGGNAQLTAAATALGTTFGTNDNWTEGNPTPTSGALMGLLGDNDLRAIDVSKAAVDPDGFRRLLLMAASAMGMPEIYYGAAEGSFATAKSMDRPTELQFLDRQSFWGDIITDVLTIAVEAAATAPGNKALTSDGYDEATGLMKLRAGGEDVDIEIDVDFPPILQKDVQAYLQALTTFTTQNGQAIQAMNDGPTLYRMALTALGEDNVEEIVEKFYPTDGSEPETQPIETYEPPLSPDDVQEELQKKIDAAASAPPPPAPGTPLGNQPRAQGPAGGDKEPAGRGGPNAVARESGGLDDEAAARIEFMVGLLKLRADLAEVAQHKSEA